VILATLRKSLFSRIKTLAADFPGELPINPAPAHVQADIALPWALALAKPLKKKPLDIAQELAQLFAGIPEIELITVTPPGFVNLKLRTSALAANARAITLHPGLYGADEAAAGKPAVLLEFVSANPTGPLHLASGRGATLGDSLARVMKRLGRKVFCEYYVNDAGGRVELLGQSISARYHNTEVPEKGYHGDYLIDLAKAAPAEAKDWTAKAWGEYAMKILLESHKADMKTFDVHFDRWFLESELFASNAVQKTLEYLKTRGMVYEKESAVWLGTSNAAESEDDKDRVLVKSDGKPTYFLPDIAYHKDKYERGYGFLIDIWGADHHGYVPRMKAAIAALGKDPESFHPIVHQLIHLFRGAEAVKMSKRAGSFVALKEVVDEVGKDACRFFFALRTPDSHLNFDLELAKKQSSDNPVFYCQYVHARINSIFAEAEKKGVFKSGDSLPGPNGALLEEPEERALLLKVAWFPEILKSVERELSPHPLANYVLELSGLFHPFYEKHRVVDAGNIPLSQARILLIASVRDVIREALNLLGVSAPERM
jgi:arginyl-tRNA synthetase